MSTARPPQPIVHDVITARGVCATCGETAAWIAYMGWPSVEHEHAHDPDTGSCRCGETTATPAHREG